MYVSVGSRTSTFDRSLILTLGGHPDRCFSCPRIQGTLFDCLIVSSIVVCGHVSNWLQSRAIDLSSVVDAVRDPEETTSMCNDQLWVLSTIPIPIAPEAVKSVIERRGFQSLGAFVASKFIPQQLQTCACSCGKEFDIVTPTGYQSATVYGTSTSILVNVPFFACSDSNCKKKLAFDGLYHGFVAVRSSTYFDIELVLQIYHLLFLSMVTMTGIFMTISQQHLVFGTEFCSKTLFIDAVWS